MKRLGRILYRVATAFSLLLCLSIAGVWMRSGWVSDTFGWHNEPARQSLDDVHFIWISRGGVQWGAWRFVGGGLAAGEERRFKHSRDRSKDYPSLQASIGLPPSSTIKHYAALGFEWVPQAEVQMPAGLDGSVAVRSFTLPLYFPSLLFALLPGHYFLPVRRRRRIAKRLARGCCTACGYDLRASPGRCPECGAVAAGEN
jgi:hypothetical protein